MYDILDSFFTKYVNETSDYQRQRGVFSHLFFLSSQQIISRYIKKIRKGDNIFKRGFRFIVLISLINTFIYAYSLSDFFLSQAFRFSYISYMLCKVYHKNLQKALTIL